MPQDPQQQSTRRQAIHALLRDGPVATQQALVRTLKLQGLDATQSSVSRDLNELGAIKTSSGYELPNTKGHSADELAQVADLLRGCKAAGPNLLVIKTAIGAAQRVALALDRSNMPEIVGNVGGDDTVFSATADAAGQRYLISLLKRLAAPAGI